ncbi:DUF397 domain-containing protein [Amycolatopsis decaplanina]|uniref:DUF397 domain-containing protein n=1 Tax=Amycolatopsis decaplanina DSM 44594 TaxID=1284240 RepID=M2YAR0_9PSEU|nr:DUF397 domain-containing protein [Amycolatopsis decaplanina]EME51977.1 hypothetical protein H074_34498 [Amycolatopsis decaplanina DSM 44594]
MSHNIANDGLAWRKAKASVGEGACVELAVTPTGEIALRNSNRPAEGTLPFTKREIAAFLTGARDGEFDDMVV